MKTQLRLQSDPSATRPPEGRDSPLKPRHRLQNNPSIPPHALLELLGMTPHHARLVHHSTGTRACRGCPSWSTSPSPPASQSSTACWPSASRRSSCGRARPSASWSPRDSRRVRARPGHRPCPLEPAPPPQGKANPLPHRPCPLEPALRRALLGVLRPHHLDVGDRGLPPRPVRPEPATGEQANRANAPAGIPSGGALTCTAPAAPNPTGRAGAAIRRRG